MASIPLVQLGEGAVLHRQDAHESTSGARQSTQEDESWGGLESLDFQPKVSTVYRSWLASGARRARQGSSFGASYDSSNHSSSSCFCIPFLQQRRIRVGAWLLSASIGSMVGLVGYLLYTAISLISSLRLDLVKHLAKHSNLQTEPKTSALLLSLPVLVAMTLAAVAAALIVYLEPKAKGSGIPEVMAYLNGVDVNSTNRDYGSQSGNVMSLKTLLVKFASTVMAVSSGMPVGPEGPMLHMGAIVGAGMSQGKIDALGWSTDLVRDFRTRENERDFMTAGVASGVAVAFGAPLGGLLFAFEEVASHWQHSLGWRVFFCCLCGVFTATLLKSFENYIFGSDKFGVYDNEWSVSFEVLQVISNHVYAIVPAIFIGVCCGILGAIFTKMALVMRTLRKKFVTKGIGRVGEVCAIVAVFAFLSALIPLVAPCTLADCVIADDGRSTCYKSIGQEYIQHVPVEPNAFVSDKLCGTRAENDGKFFYSEYATLFLGSGHETIDHLFSRSTHRQFSYSSLATLLVVYFTLAVIATDSSVSCGLFVPMLLIGSTSGRIIGLAVVDILAALGYGDTGYSPGVFIENETWRWIDPGIFALIGAGAFMGGVTRLTISIAVVTMEITNEVVFLLPIMLAIMIAKWIADALTPALYESLNEINHIPVLHLEPAITKQLDLYDAREIMHVGVIAIKEIERTDVIASVLKKTKHNGFPVVRETLDGEIFVGMISRAYLERALYHIQSTGNEHLNLSYDDMERNVADDASDGYYAAEDGRYTAAHLLSDHSVDFKVSEAGTVDLRDYVDMAAISIYEHTPIGRAYELFVQLSLRHLPVADLKGHVVGIITRKDLNPQKMEAVLQLDTHGYEDLEL